MPVYTGSRRLILQYNSRISLQNRSFSGVFGNDTGLSSNNFAAVAFSHYKRALTDNYRISMQSPAIFMAIPAYS